MTHAVLRTVSVTTASDGSATVKSDTVTGKLSQVRYVKTDFDDGSTFTITSERTGATLWAQTGVNASATVAPRQATHTTAGVAATYDGTRAVLDMIALLDDRVVVTISGGGNAKSGTFHFTFV